MAFPPDCGLLASAAIFSRMWLSSMALWTSEGKGSQQTLSPVSSALLSFNNLSGILATNGYPTKQQARGLAPALSQPGRK